MYIFYFDLLKIISKVYTYFYFVLSQIMQRDKRNVLLANRHVILIATISRDNLFN